jgi:hypothetical protein
MADECNHRDTNHTFAEMSGDDPNPFLATHKENALRAWRQHIQGEPTGAENPIAPTGIYADTPSHSGKP